MMTDFAMKVSTSQSLLTGFTAVGSVLIGVSTIAIDLGSVYDPGEGDPLQMRIRAVTACAGTGGLRVVASGTNSAAWGLAALGADGVTYGSTTDVPLASLALNTDLIVNLSRISNAELPVVTAASGGFFGNAVVGGIQGRRYFGAVLILSGTPTAGAVDIEFGRDLGSYTKVYPRSFTPGIV